MQYLNPVGLGPSVNTCPKCPPQFLQTTSVLTIPREMSFSFSIFSSSKGWKKLGQPHPESNFVSDSNRGVPQAAHL